MINSIGRCSCDGIPNSICIASGIGKEESYTGFTTEADSYNLSRIGWAHIPTIGGTVIAAVAASISWCTKKHKDDYDLP